MRILIENDHIQIQYTEPQDISFVVQAETEQENAQYIGQWSFEEHKNALDDVDILHLLIKNRAGESVGYIILKGMTNSNDSIEFMRIVITEKGYGYGASALSLIKKWCFEARHAHRLWLDVQEDNTRAQHVYKSQGFKREGLLRECMKVGDNYKSLVVMAMLAQEYKKENTLKNQSTSDLLNKLDQIHTTTLGIERIRRNLDLADVDIVAWCKTKIKAADHIVKQGKNWYIHTDHTIITVNASSFTIITAHKAKKG